MTARRRLTPNRQPRRRINWQAVIGVFLIAVGAYSAGSVYHQGEVAQEQAACQTRLNATFLGALVQRDAANRGLAMAQRDLIRAPSQQDDPDARAAANRRYLAALDEQTRSREENPLPKVAQC